MKDKVVRKFRANITRDMKKRKASLLKKEESANTKEYEEAFSRILPSVRQTLAKKQKLTEDFFAGKTTFHKLSRFRPWFNDEE